MADRQSVLRALLRSSRQKTQRPLLGHWNGKSRPRLRKRVQLHPRNSAIFLSIFFAGSFPSTRHGALMQSSQFKIRRFRQNLAGGDAPVKWRKQLSPHYRRVGGILAPPLRMAFLPKFKNEFERESFGEAFGIRFVLLLSFFMCIGAALTELLFRLELPVQTIRDPLSSRYLPPF